MSKVLIAVDLQKDFVDGTLGSKAAQKIVSPVANYIKDCKKMVLLSLLPAMSTTLNLQKLKKAKHFLNIASRENVVL